MRGSLTVSEFRDGKIEKQTVSNMLVYQLHIALTHLLGQAVSANTPTLSGLATDYKLSKMKFGVSEKLTEVEMVDLVSPIPKINTEMFYNTLSASYSTGASLDSEITISTYMDGPYGNNNQTSLFYREAGLYTANGIMVARATFDGVQKTPVTSILFEWKIYQA